MESFFESVKNLFGSSDSLPWIDAQAIEACEQDVTDPGQAASKEENLSKLAWALVHSRKESDVLRGIAMLEDQLAKGLAKERRRETLYLLAVGFFRTQDYTRSKHAVDEALREAPNFYQATSLKKMVEQKITQDGLIGAGIAAAAVAAVGATVAVVLGASKK